MRHLKTIWCLLFPAYAAMAFSAPAHALNDGTAIIPLFREPQFATLSPEAVNVF